MFLEKELEREFLEFAMPRQKVIALRGMFIFNAFSAIFILLDIQSHNYTGFESNVFISRALFFILSIPLIVATIKSKTNQSYTTYIFIFVLLAISHNFFVQLTRSPTEIMAVSIDTIFILGIYLLFRIELKYELILALLLTYSSFYVSTYHREMIGIEYSRVLFILLAANVVGFYMSNYWQHTERLMFKANKEEQILKEKYKLALESVKTLTGLIPICSSCGKIKDDEGYWKKVEEYLSKATSAQFSHSVCRSCIKDLYGDEILQAVIKAEEDEDNDDAKEQSTK